MLSYLSINNFVLIEQLQINFEDDLSIITGETGAGKSILLGALGLVLGVRADLSTIKDKSRKCVIEATFKIKDYNLKSFFEEQDLDYEEETLIRREILPSGKSRAFINDTPIVLSTLQNLSQSLIDVHSQQDTQRLNDLAFQFQIIDSLAKTQSDLSQFQKTFEELKNLEFELEQLKADQKEKQRNYEYNQFIYDELVKAQLKPDELEELESSLEKLEHIDLIAQSLNTAITLTETEEFGLQEALQKYKLALETVARYDSNFSEIFERANSLKIEFDDINEAVLDYQERMNLDPQELLTKQNRLNLINGLLQKHHVVTVADLIQKQEALEIDIENVEQAEALFKDKEKHIQQLNASLLVLGEDIHKKRKAIIPNLQKQLENYLEQLGMQKARFAIRLTATKQFFTHGIDQLEFLFSANQGVDFGKMAKVASGGERSGMMLAIKAVLSAYSKLPTIIFDEIDTGISGEVANTVGEILQNMAKNMQVIAISHLPQIAAKGLHHFKVYKTVDSNDTKTHLKLLSQEERVLEIAEMLGGKKLSDSAILHAKSLLR